ncbi:MAG: hypothetical protein KJZ47_13330, partial [Gemmatimonadales bacterium]|nr:hypothetical protein [Gemmatimonadales bacterium]
GAGPGEMRRGGKLGWVGDTLWVADRGQPRVVLFSTTLEVAATLNVMASLPFPTHLPYPEALLPNGAVLVAGLPLSQTVRGNPLERQVTQTFAYLAVVSRSGGFERLLAMLPRTEREMSIPVEFSGRRGIAAPPQPFSDDPIWAVSHDGGMLVTVGPVVERGGSGYRVTGIATSGDTVFRRRFEAPASPVTEADIVDAIERLRNEVRPGIPATVDEATFRSQVWRPAQIPPVESVMVGRDGLTWLRMRPQAGSRIVAYRVLDRSGRAIGETTLPRGDVIVESDGSRAWATTISTEGEPQVKYFRIIR